MIYIKKHWAIFKKSFNLDLLLVKLCITDIIFMISLIFSYYLVYFFWIKNVLSITNILSVTQSNILPENISGTALLNSWNTFIFNLVLLIILIVLIYVVLLSIYGAVSHKFITNNKFSSKLFLNFFYIYGILTSIYLLIIISIFYLSTDVWLIAWSIFILTIIYMYFLLIFYLVINDAKLSKIFHKGFTSLIKLHHTLMPIIVFFILFTLVFLVMALIFGKLIILFVILSLLFILYLINCLKRYLHQIIHS